VRSDVVYNLRSLYYARTMKLTRSIIIFPQFDRDIDLIQNIRHQYDPFASKIAPHITLVFPFESEISSDALHQHIKTSLEGFKPFSLSLQGISHEEGNYLFLNLIKGQQQIIKIHDLLYSKILERFLSQQHHYKPHLTVGHLQNLLATEAAINQLQSFNHEFTTEVNEITTEIILEDLTSKVDFAVTLA
jgi:2'-5' RNA ligase